MCYVENTACDSCDAVGLCIVVPGHVDDQYVLCADCVRIDEEMISGDTDTDDDEIDADDAWDDFDFTGVDAEYDYDSAEDDGDMYGDDLTFADERDFDMSDEF